MAQRRMFSLQIVDTDAFLEMPASSQNLYFHLCMRADDDGFVSNPKKIMKVVNCSEDDIKILFSKRFILGFDNGIIVIKHWKMHNYIAKDRYHETSYKDEKSKLTTKENGSYTECIRPCIQDVDSGKVRLGKVSQVKDSIEDMSCKDDIISIISYLNLKANTSFRSNSKKTLSFIKARLNEKWTLDDFKKVIDNKCSQWLKDNKMCMYLRPETLFGTKFESYLNEKINGNVNSKYNDEDFEVKI